MDLSQDRLLQNDQTTQLLNPTVP